MSQEQKMVTTDEFVDHMQEQIRIAEVRLKLQQLNTAIAKDRAEELNALMFIAQVTKPSGAPTNEELEEEEIEEEMLSKKRKLKSE